MSLKNNQKKEDGNVIEKLGNVEIVNNEFHLVKKFENVSNRFKIEFQDLNLEKMQEVYLVFIHEKTGQKVVFQCEKTGQQLVEVMIDQSIFSRLDNPYNLHKWKSAITYYLDEKIHMKLLKNMQKERKKHSFLDIILNQKRDENDIYYRNEIDLYTGKVKKNTSELEIEDYMFEIIPLYNENGFLCINTIAKFLSFYRNQQFGIYNFFVMDHGFRLQVCLPEYFSRIEKICVIPRTARPIEIGEYEINYKIIKQQKGSMEIEIDIDSNMVYYYADKWNISLFLQYNGHSFICPLVAIYKKVMTIHSEEKNYVNDPVELQIEVEKNGAFSFECKMDPYYEKSFLYRYAQALEEKTDSSVLELIQQNKISVLGKINAKLETIQENQLSIQLINETLVRCLDTNIVFIKENRFEVLVGEIKFLSETKGAIIVEYPNLNKKFICQSKEIWNICLAVKRNGLYYVLRLEDPLIQKEK